jgi:hypothetical protein
MIKRSILALGLVLSLAACEAPSPTGQTNKGVQAQKAAAAAEQIQFSENAEIDNIRKRLELTSNPGQIGFILLLNEAGQPTMYASVKGKITSGSKRLTNPSAVLRTDCGAAEVCDTVVTGPSDEGTYGSSDPYVYFWTTEGQYIQTTSKYIYSDKPIRTSIKPLVISGVQ